MINCILLLPACVPIALVYSQYAGQDIDLETKEIIQDDKDFVR